MQKQQKKAVGHVYIHVLGFARKLGGDPMRGISRLLSAFLHSIQERKSKFPDFGIGKWESEGGILAQFFGYFRNGDLWFRSPSHWVLRIRNRRKLPEETPAVKENENLDRAECGELIEDGGGHMGAINLDDSELEENRKGSSFSVQHLSVSNEINEIQRILKRGGSEVDVFLDQLAPAVSVGLAIKVMESEKDVRLSFRFFLWAVRTKHLKKSRDLRNLMIAILRESKEFEAAWEVLKRIEGEGQKISVAPFIVLMSAYAKAGMVEKAIESFTVMKKFSCKADTFTWNTLIHILLTHQAIQIANVLYRRMLKVGCRPNLYTFNILIDGLCKAGKVQDALALFDEMTAKGITPNTMTYTSVLHGLCQAGKIDEASKLLGSMKENNCSKDIVLYNAMINGLCKARKVDRAFELFHSLEELNICPDAYTYTSLIHGLFKAGKFDEARKYFRDWFEGQATPSLVSYNMMINEFCKADKIDKAFELLTVMTAKQCLPDTHCYNTLIKGLCNVRQIDKARALKLEMAQKGCPPDDATYTTLIHGLCKEGLVDEARRMFDEMTRIGLLPTVMTYNILINGLCNAGEVEKAYILFYKMEMGNNPSLFLSITQGSDSIADGADFQALVERLCNSDQTLRAYKLVRRLIESGVMPDTVTYNTLMNGLCKADKLEGALKLFKEMLLKGYRPDVYTYNILINGLCRANRDADAFTLFNQMAGKGCNPNVATYKTLMISLSHRGRLSQAFQLWINHMSQRSGINNQDFCNIQLIQKIFEEGNLVEAFRTAVKMDMMQDAADSGAYCIIIIALYKAGRLDDALKLVGIVQEHNLDLTASTYVLLITGLCEDGRLTAAVELFRESLERGILLKSPVCNKILRGLCLQGRKDKAHDILNEMIHAGYDLKIFLDDNSRALLEIGGPTSTI